MIETLERWTLGSSLQRRKNFLGKVVRNYKNDQKHEYTNSKSLDQVFYSKRDWTVDKDDAGTRLDINYDKCEEKFASCSVFHKAANYLAQTRLIHELRMCSRVKFIWKLDYSEDPFKKKTKNRHKIVTIKVEHLPTYPVCEHSCPCELGGQWRFFLAFIRFG